MSTSLPTTTSRRGNITPLKLYLLTLSILTTTLLTTISYLTYGILISILTLLTFLTLLSCSYMCAISKYNMVQYICYPRYYMVWSEWRRCAVDNVRERGLYKLLNDCTLTLEKEHMIPSRAATFTKTASSSTSTTTIDSSLSSFESSSLSSSSCTMEPPSSLEEIDLELGNNCSTTAGDTGDTSAASDKIVVEDEQDENVASEYDASNTVKADNASSGTAASSSPDDIMMVTKEAEKEDEDTAASSTCVTDDCSTHIRIPCHPAAAEEDDAYSTKTRTRDVPINCPICLSTYQPSDPICYSPNYPKCSHVFHQSCIIKWFVEVGRHDSTIVIGHYDSLLSMKKKKSRLNDEKYLLGYRLECPCCRQVFVGDDDEVCGTKEDKDDAEYDEEERVDEDGSKEETMVATERVLEKEENELFDEEKGILEAKATATATGSVLPQ